MQFQEPTIEDYGSIAQHTFTNTGQVPGRGPSGKDPRPLTTLDKFGEESAPGLS